MMNREAWLHALAHRLAPWFEELGHPLPERYRVSCGFPSRSSLSQHRRRVGECWSAEVSGSGHREIFVSPVLDDPVEVAQVVVHELLHAALPDGVGHRAPFPRLARQLGLEGRPSATVAGELFRERIAPLLAELGPYPHTRITPTRRARPAAQRPIKATCASCGYSVRITRKWVRAAGAPLCPCAGGGPMDIPEEVVEG